MKVAYIKPVWSQNRLLSLALCKSDSVIVDEDIIEHFDKNERGKDIKEIATELGYEKVIWGTQIEV